VLLSTSLPVLALVACSNQPNPPSSMQKAIGPAGRMVGLSSELL
jgi:hypothetical protein